MRIREPHFGEAGQFMGRSVERMGGDVVAMSMEEEPTFTHGMYTMAPAPSGAMTYSAAQLGVKK